MKCSYELSGFLSNGDMKRKICVLFFFFELKLFSMLCIQGCFVNKCFYLLGINLRVLWKACFCEEQTGQELCFPVWEFLCVVKAIICCTGTVLNTATYIYIWALACRKKKKGSFPVACIIHDNSKCSFWHYSFHNNYIFFFLWDTYVAALVLYLRYLYCRRI